MRCCDANTGNLASYNPGWTTVEGAKKPVEQVNKILLNARSIMVLGIDFESNLSSAELVRLNFFRIKNAFYEEAEATDIAAGLNPGLVMDGYINVCELLDEVVEMQLLGELRRAQKAVNDTAREKPLRFKYVTVPVRLTFKTVKVKIENKNWIRDYTQYRVLNYWHHSTKLVKDELEYIFKSDSNTYQAFRACGNSLIKVSEKAKATQKWTTLGYYSHKTCDLYELQPNFNCETLESEEGPINPNLKTINDAKPRQSPRKRKANSQDENMESQSKKANNREDPVENKTNESAMLPDDNIMEISDNHFSVSQQSAKKNTRKDRQSC